MTHDKATLAALGSAAVKGLLAINFFWANFDTATLYISLLGMISAAKTNFGRMWS